jgi:hypothetical protein
MTMRLPFMIVLAALLLAPLTGHAQQQDIRQAQVASLSSYEASDEEGRRVFAIGAGAIVGGIVAFYTTGFVLGGVAGYYALDFPGATLVGAAIGGVAGDWWYHGHLKMGMEDLKKGP